MNSEEVINSHQVNIKQLETENKQLGNLREELAKNKKAAFTAKMSKAPGATMFHSKGEVNKRLFLIIRWF